MTTATITAMRYEDTLSVPAPSPLAPDATAEVTLDNVVVTFDVDTLVHGHELHFKPEAVGNRMVGYSLDQEKAAVEALVRELVFAWSPDLQPADPANRVDVNGGIDDRITVAWSIDDLTIDAVLAPLAVRIQAAQAIFSGTAA